jgi:hypothetical protein
MIYLMMCNAIKLFSIIDWYVTDSIIALPHTSTGPTDHTTTDAATPENVAFTVLGQYIHMGNGMY